MKVVGSDEDRRTAAGITVALSSQLIAASLAALGFAVAAWTFVADKRQTGLVWGICCFGSFGAFVASIFVGGKGITHVRNHGFNGNWNLDAAKGSFNRQAFLCFIALAIFLLSLFIPGESKDESLSIRVSRLEALQHLTHP